MNFHQDKPTLGNTVVLIITYNPDHFLDERIFILLKQINNIYIVDNSDKNITRKKVNDICKKCGIELLQNNENFGIAKALNQGFQLIQKKDKNAKWVLTLDQDSICSEDLISNLFNCYHLMIKESPLGIIGTNYREKTTEQVLHNPTTNLAAEIVEKLPTSGCLTNINAYCSTKGFREEFFIDYVDIDFCNRLRERGYSIVISNEIGMEHPLGYYRNSKLSKLIMNSNKVSNYSCLRHYYWTRNGTVLIIENLTKDTRWSLNEMIYIYLKRPIKIILFEDKKIKKIINIIFGVYHALIKRSGKF